MEINLNVRNVGVLFDKHLHNCLGIIGVMFMLVNNTNFQLIEDGIVVK